MTHVRIEREFAGRPLVLETGRLAKQADGAVLVTYGETIVLATAQSAKAREGIDFFPLTVDYREKTYAAGKFPGGFFKREARPTQKETLTARLIDRPVRPLFPEGYFEEVQLMTTALSFDGEVDPDIVAMIGTFAAVAISPIPFLAPLGACRVGYVDGKVVINPACGVVTRRETDLNLVIAASRDAITMVEAGSKGVNEEIMLEALARGHDACREVIGMIEELVEKAGKPKKAWTPPEAHKTLDKELEKKFWRQIQAAVSAPGSKRDRKDAIDAVKAEVKDTYEKKAAKLEPAEATATQQYVAKKFSELCDRAERQAILSGRRTDGRGHEDIRTITTEVGLLPRTHGSALFTRGETQALVVATLGTVDDEQVIDGLEEEVRKKFLLHYNFPPFSVGEAKPIRGPGRREIGHGALAERSLEAVLPGPEEFPYTIRLVSEILESNGSSSMATVCGSTLALMDAGVPIRQPVAGVAMGLVKEGDQIAILTDIHGSEDHTGDMDFKVAGTQHGITALQMDIKCSGLTGEIMARALDQARRARIRILKDMLQSLRRPRGEISPLAPRLIRLKIDPEKIGAVIGPGGKHIRALQEETKTKINIDDDGTVTVAGVVAELVDKAVAQIQAMTAEPEIDQTYEGRVVSIKEFGAFIEILPGQEGLLHVSELSHDFVRSVTDLMRVGDVVKVKVIDVDPMGKIKLSRKALLEGGQGDQRPSERQPERGEERVAEASDWPTPEPVEAGRDRDRERGRSGGRRPGRGDYRSRPDREGGRPPRREHGGRGGEGGRRERHRRP